MFDFSFDKASGILSVRVIGAWTLAEIHRYSDELAVHAPKARKVAGSLLLLVDNRKCQLVSKELSVPLGQAGQRVAAENDRLAIVVNSTLMKMQTRRLLASAAHGVFVDEDEARAWLASAALAKTA